MLCLKEQTCTDRSSSPNTKLSLEIPDTEKEIPSSLHIQVCNGVSRESWQRGRQPHEVGTPGARSPALGILGFVANEGAKNKTTREALTSSNAVKIRICIFVPPGFGHTQLYADPQRRCSLHQSGDVVLQWYIILRLSAWCTNYHQSKLTKRKTDPSLSLSRFRSRSLSRHQDSCTIKKSWREREKEKLRGAFLFGCIRISAKRPILIFLHPSTFVVPHHPSIVFDSSSFVLCFVHQSFIPRMCILCRLYKTPNRKRLSLWMTWPSVALLFIHIIHVDNSEVSLL